MAERALAIDLYCGLGGWTSGLLAAGYRVIGFDIERHEYDGERYPAQLVLQDVRTLHGAQFRDAALIVASPPCQEFSYMAMPWSRGKQIARALRGEDDFPAGYNGSRTVADLTALFDACFRIQREASHAAGRHIPLVVENVRGAEPWVGPAAWSYGSYYLWGDVPALMPHRVNGRKNPGFRFDGSGRSFQTEGVNRHVAPAEGYKSRGMDWNNRSLRGQDFTGIAGAQAQVAEGRKGAGAGAGAEWFDGNLCALPSSSPRRKAASARIAKIPYTLSHWIGRVYALEAAAP